MPRRRRSVAKAKTPTAARGKRGKSKRKLKSKPKKSNGMGLTETEVFEKMLRQEGSIMWTGVHRKNNVDRYIKEHPEQALQRSFEDLSLGVDIDASTTQNSQLLRSPSSYASTPAQRRRTGMRVVTTGTYKTHATPRRVSGPAVTSKAGMPEIKARRWGCQNYSLVLRYADEDSNLASTRIADLSGKPYETASRTRRGRKLKGRVCSGSGVRDPGYVRTSLKSFPAVTFDSGRRKSFNYMDHRDINAKYIVPWKPDPFPKCQTYDDRENLF